MKKECCRVSCIVDIALAVTLFVFFAFRLYLAGQGKAFWMDESDGLYYTRNTGFLDLLLNGSPTGQASKSPLPYLIDKLWISAWGDIPQRYWDLRLFFRVPQVSFWAAANVFLFFHLRRTFNELMGGRGWQPWLFAMGVTLFTYSNSFASYYAIESRAYSLWGSLSLAHLLLLWDVLRKPEDGKSWGWFCAVSFLLVAATYTSAFQIALATMVVYANDALAKKSWFPSSRLLRRTAALFLITAPITFYYYSKIPFMDFGKPTWEIFGKGLLEVVLKAFHHHSYHPVLVTGPLILLGLPFYWWKRDRVLALMTIHTAALLLLSLLIFLISRAKGGIFASRYIIYAVAGLSFSYFLGIYTLTGFLARLVPAKWRARAPLAILTLLAIAQVTARPWAFYKDLGKDLQKFRDRNGYMVNEDPACNGDLAHDPEPLEKLNDLCRKL